MSSNRLAITSQTKPSFVTVLDADKDPQEDWLREDYLKMKYSGPLYFDWDAEDIDLSIAGFKQFLNNLEREHSFSLGQARLFATGGRGFHMEIPMGAFISKPPSSGVTQLPLIYREMATSLYVNTLDMRVYSARRGRMWRVPNVQRSNGAYKVPISVEEALGMTSETYAQLCAAPRYYQGREAEYPDAPWLTDPKGEVPMPEAATVNLGLQALFGSRKSLVEGVLRRQARARDDRKALAKYQGVVPVSVKEILNGQCLREDAGFNDIALQFAILATEFGMGEAEFVEACEGLIKGHNGDGSRYSTPARRAQALRERLAYVQGSNVYRFSLNALFSVCDPAAAPADLFGALAEEGARHAPTLTKEQIERGDVPEVADQKEAQNLRSVMHIGQGAVRVTPMGVYARRPGNELELLSTLVIANPRLQLAAETKELLGISAYVAPVSDTGANVRLEPYRFDADAFSSRSSLDRVFSGLRSSFRGTDINATDLRTILVNTATANEDVQYVLNREGMDVIERLDTDARGATSMAWVTKSRVVLPEDLEGGQAPDFPRFIFKPKLTSESRLRLDVHDFEPPEPGDQKFLEFMENLLKVNAPEVVAAVFGWFVSCFHRQLHHVTHNEFPLVWLYGPAGSGKTTTPGVFCHLFTSAPPTSWSTLQRGVTSYAWRVMMSRSTTMPTIVDEFKESDFDAKTYGQYLNDFRSAYNQGMMASGGISSGSARATWRNVEEIERSAPLLVISETFVSESATRERSIPVSVRPADADPQAWDFVNRPENLVYMTRLGSLLMRRTLSIDPSDFTEKWEQARDYVRGLMPKEPLRVTANYAVVKMGLDFLQESLAVGVGLDMGKEIVALESALWKAAKHNTKILPTRSEADKTLQDLAYLSNDMESSDPLSIREGVEYAFVANELHIDLRAVGMRYAPAMARYKQSPFFKGGDSLCAGLARHPAVINDDCVHSPLYTYRGARVFSFSLQKLAECGVQPFKGQPSQE